MYFIAGFGLVMLYFCGYMLVKPKQFASSIIRFSRWQYFHVFEICSRIVLGILFIVVAKTSLLPTVFQGLGVLLLAVAVGLVLIGANQHQQFAVFAATKFKDSFRLIGILSLPLPLAIIYFSGVL